MSHTSCKSIGLAHVELAPSTAHLYYLGVFDTASSKFNVDDKLENHEDVRLDDVVLVSCSEQDWVKAIVSHTLELPEVLS